MGARRRHYKGQWADEVGSSTQRNIHKGALELFGLGKNAIYEENVTNYDKEERKLFEISADISKLIQDMERKSDDEPVKKEEK